jgi:hypothetical protein
MSATTVYTEGSRVIVFARAIETGIPDCHVSSYQRKTLANGTTVTVVGVADAYSTRERRIEVRDDRVIHQPIRTVKSPMRGPIRFGGLAARVSHLQCRVW